MVFSSPTFLFLFLPIVLIGYFLIRTELRNVFLLGASLLFYAWGEVFYTTIMLVSIGMNYGFGRLLASQLQQKHTNVQKYVVAAGILCNLSLLIYFKYANFLLHNLNTARQGLGLEPIAFSPVHLPIGISFFTFQAMSYLIDVYRREMNVQKNLINCALYISLFPQLIAGPIVRYHDVARQIVSRTVAPFRFSSGIQRFIFGLSKKVLVANPLGEIADTIFAVQNNELTSGMAWLGIFCYALQIYFDFSGYSDMAIGLGRMFGFEFLENFKYPYIAQSIKEFWRRWHISLSNVIRTF